MKKILLLTTIILATISFANAQDFTLSQHGTVLGDTVTADSINVGAQEMIIEAAFNNNTNETVNIKVLRNIIYMMEGDATYFCWGACFGDTTNLSPGPVTVGPNSSTGEMDFSGHYKYVGGVHGIALVEYKFFNADNPDQHVTIVVKYDNSIDGIDETILNNVSVSDIYPNPASDYVTVDYDFPAEVDVANIKIVNVLGSVVKEEQLETNNNKVKINISDLKDGIYFYSIFLNEEIYNTKKLIVR